MAQTNNTSNNNLGVKLTNLVNGDNTITSMPQSGGGQTTYLMSVCISGANIDIRELYVISNNGYAASGNIALLSTYQYLKNNANFELDNITMVGAGNQTVHLNCTIAAAEPVACRVYLSPMGGTNCLNNT